MSAAIRWRSAILAVPATFLLLTVCAAEPSPNANADPVRSTPSSDARLEPTTGIYFGVSLDWSADSARSFNDRLGKKSAVYVQFTHFPMSKEDVGYVDEFIEQVEAEGGIALLTLEPTLPLREISQAEALGLAEQLRLYNERGVPIIVRFAHEMNGSWYPWSQQPADYVRAFRLLAEAIHTQAPRSAILWAPNYGGGYPFKGGPHEAKSDTADFAALDTNGDAMLDQNDDMYAPYYPGDDAVDWVGMTLYHWGDHWPWGRNVLPEADKFAQQLTGTYNGAGGDDRALPDFYQTYAEIHGKPMAIPETSAFYNTTASGTPEAEIKEAWWQQLFSEQVATEFPRIKMINWFEWRKAESEVQGAVVDWRLTSQPGMAAKFLSDLPAGRFLFAEELRAGTEQSDWLTSSPPQ